MSGIVKGGDGSVGDEGGKTVAEIDRQAIEKYNKSLQISLEREARLHQHHQWRGAKLPPFNIEPLPWERQRIQGAGMTAEDRALRRQWLKDQELSPREPVFIPELYPRNPIRRMLGAPWDRVFLVLQPVVGERYAGLGRFFIPKFAMAIGTMYAIYYHLKYNPNQWTDGHGWNIYSNKPTLLPEGQEVPVKTDSDFYDRGFKHRKALLNEN